MDIFSTVILARVVAELPPPTPFLLNSFFREEQRSTTEEIYFDVDNGKRRLAPFVSPVVAGKVVENRGFQTKSFKPAYVKDKRRFLPSAALKRTIGEAIGGNLSPEQRIQLNLARSLADQVDMLTRRLEWMAAKVLTTGAVTITGDQYPTTQVNFGRDPALTVALSGANRWGQSGVKPLQDLQDWSLLVTQKSGTAPTVVTMTADAYALFAADPDVKELLDRFRGRDALHPTVVGEGGRYMGSIGDFDIYVFAGWYEDPDGAGSTPYLPPFTVLLTSPDLDGVRAYGAILDEEAGLQALPYFVKSWIEKDPGVRMLLMQSAPLTVPYRVNASFCATVN